ncbi:hypothetical protein SEVIR_5G058800v4 [Setaria viridis]|uniref:Uncharacterized protein n=2 Tax=Setaria viridis TaxID=4556 RepID=A0A4U6UFE0_SETVI|nr:uncharacterized protein LOC117856730 [Setaria viridis]TKW12803.1 hypothetical protein SEVIR_5G058800v2 [Setaria viridis]
MHAAPTTAAVAMPAAVTHDDLSLRKAQERRAARSSGQVAVALVALSVICGLVAFILCLAAEGSRSEVSYYLMSVGGSQDQLDVCFYNSSGRTALAYAVGAFILLAVAMFAEHAYMLVAVAVPDSASAGLAVAQDHPRVASSAATLTWQTCCLFFLTWICFGLAEVLLMIGIGIESGHISDWRKPRPVCHRVRPGMFAAAGILGLITVVVGFVVYVTAVQAQRLRGQQHYGGGHFVGHGAPYPGVQHQHLRPPMPHPHPHPAPTAPGAPEITAAPCQVEPSRASLITKEVAEV